MKSKQENPTPPRGVFPQRNAPHRGRGHEAEPPRNRKEQVFRNKDAKGGTAAQKRQHRKGAAVVTVSVQCLLRNICRKVFSPEDLHWISRLKKGRHVCGGKSRVLTYGKVTGTAF